MRAISWTLPLLLLLPARAEADWVRQAAGLGDRSGYLDIWALSPRFAAAAGVVKEGSDSVPTVAITRDGKTWAPAMRAKPTSPFDLHLFLAVWFRDEKKGVVGGIGEIFVTEDGGASWSRVDLGGLLTGRSVTDVHSGDGGATLLAVTSLGEVLRSQDGGKSWPVLGKPLGEAALGRVLFADAKLGWVTAGEEVRDAEENLTGYKGGGLALTLDGGQSWTTAFSGEARQVLDVSFSGQRGFMISASMQGPRLEQSSDGGRSWRPLAFPESTSIGKVSGLAAVRFFDGCEGWLMGSAGQNDFGVLWRSTDGGQSWVEAKRDFLALPNPFGLPLEAKLVTFAFAGRSVGWASGTYETLFRYDASEPAPTCAAGPAQGDGGPAASSGGGCGCELAGGTPPIGVALLLGLGLLGLRSRRVLLLGLLALLLLPACSGRREALKKTEPGGSTPPQVPARPATRKLVSALPEQGPHPDYPTPVAAGTDKIFFLEEPERGPRPEPASIPTVQGLRWTIHASCELDLFALACGPGLAKPRFGHWRVGRKGKQIVLAEDRAGERVHRTLHFVHGPSGVERVSQFDTYGDLEWTRYVDRERGRYSARRLNGGNALQGCGYHAFKLGPSGFADEVTCLQWLGEPMRDLNGVAISRYERDARGFTLSLKRFAADGTAIVGHDGVHQVKTLLEASGEAREEHYLDVSGKPVRSSSDACAGHRWRYDQRGLRVEEICLGPDGSPGEITRSRANAAGCLTGKRHLLADGKPAAPYGGVHGFDYTVDERCAELSKTCLNVVELPLACGPGEPARQVTLRDAHGRATSIKHYVAKGTAGGDAYYGVFEIRKRYDERGNLLGNACYGATGTAVLCGTTGFHAISFKYDDAGRDVEERFWAPSGEAGTNLGTSVRRFQHDNYDHVFESRNYDSRGKLFEAMGMAIRRELYDAGHRRFAVVLLDRSGKPARYTGCYSGATCPRGAWHAVRIVRRPNGSVVKNQFFDAAGQLVATYQCGGTTRCFD